MDGRLVVLKRFVEALGQDGDISSLDGRTRFQKAVYLGQLCGIDLGYRYGWYLKGPYSTELTRDYYAMAQATAAGQTPPANQQLKPELLQKLAKMKPLFCEPANIGLSQTQWLELLASWHFLRWVNRYDECKARKVMEQEKPVLAPYVQRAERVLKASQLM